MMICQKERKIHKGEHRPENHTRPEITGNEKRSVVSEGIQVSAISFRGLWLSRLFHHKLGEALVFSMRVAAALWNEEGGRDGGMAKFNAWMQDKAQLLSDNVMAHVSRKWTVCRVRGGSISSFSLLKYNKMCGSYFSQSISNI